MLRYLFRRPRSIRVPLKNGQFDVQKVSVTKDSRINISRFATTFIISVCVVRTVDHVFPERDLKRGWDRLKSKDWWAEHWRQAPPQTPSSGDSRTVTQEKDTIHLMIPIWVRRTNSGWYKEDDPQWKALQSFAQDQKRKREVIHKIGALAGEQLKTERFLPWVRYLHAMDVTLKIDVVLPIAPPSIYEAPCIFIPQSGDITYGWRRLPYSVGNKMDRIFHPVMLTNAFYAGCKEFVRVTYVIAKARLIDRINAFSLEGDAKPTQPVKILTEEEKANQSLVVTKTSDQAMKRVLPFLRGEYGEHESRQPYRDAVRSMTYKNAIEMGCTVFRHHWITGQSMQLQRSSESIITFKGTMHCVWDKGDLHLELSAYYDVATSSLIGKPVIGVAYIVPHPDRWHASNSQAPKAAAIKPSQSAKPALKAPEKSTEPPRETATATPSPAKDEEK